MNEELIRLALLFQDAARELRRLGSGPIRHGCNSLGALEIYRFGNKVRTARFFPRDRCFELANELEEYAGKLEHLVNPNRLDS